MKLSCNLFNVTTFIIGVEGKSTQESDTAQTQNFQCCCRNNAEIKMVPSLVMQTSISTAQTKSTLKNLLLYHKSIV